MALFRDIQAFREASPRAVIAIGNFDGVHAGHRHVLAEAVRLADASAVAAAVLTFDPHPVRYFRPELPEFRLTTLTERALLLEDIGIAHLLAIPFDAELAGQSPQTFVQQILVDGVGASHVLVGDGFRFGHKRAGDTQILSDLCQAADIEVHVASLHEVGGAVVSSTAIRAALSRADFDTVRSLLGRNFVVTGNVVHGDARGRAMGYPTANVATEPRLLPPDGIYATWLYEGDRRYPSATYVGTRPTFEGEDRRIESFVLDAKGPVDLYERDVVVEFVGHVRGDAKFDSAEAMMAQMALDVAAAKKMLKS